MAESLLFLNPAAFEAFRDWPTGIAPSHAVASIGDPVGAMLRIFLALLMTDPLECLDSLSLGLLRLGLRLQQHMVTSLADQLGSSFTLHVVHVVLMCAKEQVINIAAQWVVAFMQNEQVAFYLTFCN